MSLNFISLDPSPSSFPATRWYRARHSGSTVFHMHRPSHKDSEILIGGNFIYAIIYPIFITDIAYNQVVAALCPHYVHIRNVFIVPHERKWVFPMCYECQKGFLLPRLPVPLYCNSISHFLRLASATTGPNRSDTWTMFYLVSWQKREASPYLVFAGSHQTLICVVSWCKYVGGIWGTLHPMIEPGKLEQKCNPSSAPLDHLTLSLPITQKSKAFHFRGLAASGRLRDLQIRGTNYPPLPIPLLKGQSIYSFPIA